MPPKRKQKRKPKPFPQPFPPAAPTFLPLSPRLSVAEQIRRIETGTLTLSDMFCLRSEALDSLSTPSRTPDQEHRTTAVLKILLNVARPVSALISSSSPAALAALDRGLEDPLALSKAEYLAGFASAFLAYPRGHLNQSIDMGPVSERLEQAACYFDAAHEANREIKGELGL